jgi:hypothetical protein
MEDNGPRQPLLLDIDEASRKTEEVLQWEPVSWGVMWRLFKWESKNLWRLSWASIIIQLVNFMLSLISQMFVGHLGALALAGASITNIGIQGLAYGIMVSCFPTPIKEKQRSKLLFFFCYILCVEFGVDVLFCGIRTNEFAVNTFSIHQYFYNAVLR